MQLSELYKGTTPARRDANTSPYALERRQVTLSSFSSINDINLLWELTPVCSMSLHLCARLTSFSTAWVTGQPVVKWVEHRAAGPGETGSSNQLGSRNSGYVGLFNESL